MPYIIGTLLAISAFIFTHYGKHLTLMGAVILSVVIAVFCFFALWNMLVLLIIVYGILIVIDKATYKHKQKVKNETPQKRKGRTTKQLFVNGFAALMASVLFIITDDRMFIIIYVIGIGETFVDSVASDIGIFSKRAPRDICTWKSIAPGLSGGISPLGTIISCIASIIFGFIAYFVFVFPIKEVLLIVVLSMVGNILDSLLGSWIQAKYYCNVCSTNIDKTIHCDALTDHIKGVRLIDNCAVNFLSNFIVCGFGVIWLVLRR
jgi:uncharacterized protein (TIGR00297 family)